MSGEQGRRSLITPYDVNQFSKLARQATIRLLSNEFSSYDANDIPRRHHHAHRRYLLYPSLRDIIMIPMEPMTANGHRISHRMQILQ